METVPDFIFLGSKITADGDCSHEIKRHLLLGEKNHWNPRQQIKKQGHYFVSVWKSDCGVAWTFFVIAFVWDWSKNW